MECHIDRNWSNMIVKDESVNATNHRIWVEDTDNLPVVDHRQHDSNVDPKIRTHFAISLTDYR